MTRKKQSMMQDANAKNMITRLNELVEIAREGFLIHVPEFPCNEDILLSAKNSANDTLLHVASALSRDDIVSYLLDRGMPINSKGDFGYTPLHYAAEAQSKSTYDLLIQKGADSEIRNIYGDRASDLFQ